MLTIVWPALIALLGFILLILYVPPPRRMEIIGGTFMLAGMIVVCFMLAKTKLGVP